MGSNRLRQLQFCLKMTLVGPWPLFARLTRWLELALAFAGLVWISGNSVWLLSASESELRLARVYVVEDIILATLVFLALLVQFHFGAPWLKVMWFCLGMSTGLVALGMMSIGPTLLPGLALGCIAGLLAALRTQAHLIFLAGWFLAGLIFQTGLVLVLLFIGLMIISYSELVNLP